MAAVARPDRRFLISGIDPFDLAFALLLAVLLALVLATFKEYAVSNDEGLQHHYGELILAWYRSGFTDKSVFGYDNLYLYGGLFDIIAVLLSHLLPFNLYDIRHVMSAVAGIGGIAAAWATARLIGGPRAGLLAGLSLAVCGVWYGGMFNHTKDVPFAAAMMGAIFFLLRTGRELPQPKWRDVLWFGTLLGISLGLRATGLLLVGYVGVLIALELWAAREQAWPSRLRAGMRSGLHFVPALAIAYLIMIASWPWASLDFLNPARAIFAFAHFKYPIRTLIEGQVYLMNEVPRWYEPDYLVIKLPLFVHAGAAAALTWAAWSAVRNTPRPITAPGDRVRAKEIGFLAFTIIFPLSCQVIGHGPSFTGMRHFLFVVPPVAALAGIGLDLFWSMMGQNRALAGLAGVAVSGAVIWNAATLVKLHPYEYLFYNSLVGGLEGASRRYDTDYWVNIMPAAVKDLEIDLDQEAARTDPIKPPHYTVAVCGERVAFENEPHGRLEFTRDWSHADFFIAPTHMSCDQVLRGRLLNTIDRVGVTIGVVKDLRGVSAQARWNPVELAHGPAEKTGAAGQPHG
jgi:hypothetical protein